MRYVRNKAREFLDTVALRMQRPSVRGYDPGAKVGQMQLFQFYRQQALAGTLPSFETTGFRVFSPFDEDGRILFLLAVLGTAPRHFVDLGCGDGVNSNCANLAVNFGAAGCMIDGNPDNIAVARHFYTRHPDTRFAPPRTVCAFIKAENINALLAESEVPTNPDLMSLDIDGNDFHIWNAMKKVRPKVVVVETHVEFGDRDVVVPYDPDYCYPGKHPQYHGASVRAMLRLGRHKGYRCVGTHIHGFNLFFVRDDQPCVELLPEVSAEQILAHPRTQSRLHLADPVRDWKYQSSAEALA